MSAVALTLLGIAVVMVWSALSGENPLDVIRTTLTNTRR